MKFFAAWRARLALQLEELTSDWLHPKRSAIRTAVGVVKADYDKDQKEILRRIEALEGR